MKKIKCKCGVELFNRDIVLDVQSGLGIDITHTYRCPKCYKTKIVKF